MCIGISTGGPYFAHYPLQATMNPDEKQPRVRCCQLTLDAADVCKWKREVSEENRPVRLRLDIQKGWVASLLPLCRRVAVRHFLVLLCLPLGGQRQRRKWPNPKEICQ